jgi:hypothetical protein
MPRLPAVDRLPSPTDCRGAAQPKAARYGKYPLRRHANDGTNSGRLGGEYVAGQVALARHSHQPNIASSICSRVRSRIRGPSGLPMVGGSRRTFFLVSAVSFCSTASTKNCRSEIPDEVARSLARVSNSSGSSTVVRICHNYGISENRQPTVLTQPGGGDASDFEID